jgi:type I restriction enzyme S subunit
MAGEERVQLRDVCVKIGSGATPRGGKEAYKGGATSLIRSQNIYNEGFRRDGLVYINDHQSAELRNVDVKQTDVLLNITGDSVARCCQVAADVLPARVNQHVAIIRPEPKSLDARFLRYVLVSHEYQSRLLALASAGATRPALTKSMIEELDIPLPPIPEQRAIASVLGALDDKIELNRRMNATLEGMARALFQSWFVDFDPVRAKLEGRLPAGMDAETAALFPAEFEESELGLIPKGWKVTTIGDTCQAIFSGGTPSTQAASYWGGNIPWLSSGETRSTFIIETEKTITEAGVENSSTRIARAGCTVIAGAGQGHTRGQTSLLTFASYINQSVVALAANKEVSSDLFLFLDLVRRYDEFRQLSDSHSSRGSLTTKLLSGVKSILPPYELVVAFDQVAKPLATQIIANSHQIRTLATLRDTLLPKLLSGELIVGESQN